MKKFLSISVIWLIIFWWFSVFAAENTDLLDELEKLEQSEQYQAATELNQKLTFESFSTCEDMNTVLQNFLEENKDLFNHPYPVYYTDDEVMMRDMEESAVWADFWGITDSIGSPAPSSAKTVSSNSTDVSTTNIQVEWVDEPDILKTDWDYLYYYSQKEMEVYIIQSPLDRSSSSIDLNKVDIISTIKIPETFSNIQLFLQNNKLVILWQRWRDGEWRTGLLERNSRVDIMIYDVSDVKDPTLDRFTDLDGQYQDARVIDNELYVVTQLWVNWWNAWNRLDEGNDIIIDDILPQAVDVSYKKDGIKSLEIKWKQYPYGINIEKSDCNDILYVLPTKETLENTRLMPSFTVVRKVTIDEPKSDIETTTTFWSTQTIHMTKDSLYLADSIWFTWASTCPSNARCALPWFWWGEQHTLLHKFDIKTKWLDYRATSLVPWNPLTQYSMSEDSRGNFRLITQTRNPQLDTHLFVLDKDLVLEWMIRNIQPNEQFKSSRFIGNKLYLVTFERTDPLFVIDIADVTSPEIIWELKIPWYSTYLHPYAPALDGKQYLIGLWYDTSENEWWGTITNWVKVDLYEIDYTTRDDDWMIAVSQKYTETYGEQGSRSEALENPRMVVWDESRNLLVVPMLLQNQEEVKNCTIQYDSDGNEIAKNCYESNTQDTTFAWLKAITIDKDSGISEYSSYDYSKELQSSKEKYPKEYEDTNSGIYPWEFRQFMFRVWYLGDVLYSLNNAFGHFVIMWSDEEIYLPFND